jgi:hypothetical protein
VAKPCIDITYAAHTASCTFLLDSEGICRRIVMAPKGKRREGSRTASRCVGAQYVASLDAGAAGGLVEMPRVGAAMLFARVDERGRVSLVRTGIVMSFESKAAEDPFVETDSAAVETSAPDLLASIQAREAISPPPKRPSRPPVSEVPDPDYYEESDRTQRIQALRPEDIAAALGRHETRPETRQSPEPHNELTTSEYRSVNRGTAAGILDDEDDFRPTLKANPVPAPSAARGMLPRGSDPRQRAAAAAARSYAPPARTSDVQISRRRHRG